MRSSRRRRLLVPAIATAVLLLALAAVAARAVRSPSASPAAPPGCQPAPCAAPHGMELHVDQVTVVNHGTGRRLVLTVHFANHSRGELVEATSLRHTGPQDFVVHEAGGRRGNPVFGDGCPRWPDLSLARGSASEEETVCFDLLGPPRERVQLEWSPDLGLLFRSVTVDLGSLPG